MVCEGSKLRLFNAINGRTINVDSLPNLPTNPIFKKWYKNIVNNVTLGIAYIKETNTGIVILLIINCSNPITNCDCINISGTMTDAEIDEAINKLFGSRLVGNIPTDNSSSLILIIVMVIIAIILFGVSW